MTNPNRTDRGPAVVLYAEFSARPGHEDAVAALLRDYASSVRAEPGNVVFAAHRKATTAQDFFVYEEYLDDVAFHEHLSSDTNAVFNTALAPLVVGGGSKLTFIKPV